MTTSSDLQQLRKQRVAIAAMEELREGMVLGVGTGSTVNAFIDALGPWAQRLTAAVSSSEASTHKLQALGIQVLDLNEVDGLALYIDGADESNRQLQLIKGGGAALTREKIIAAAAQRFVCIVDESKLVDTLGAFPLPVEVIPMARRQVAKALAQMGCEPRHRAGCITDNGNHILDLHGLQITDAPALESHINQITGVVTVGLFAARPADLLLVGADSGVRRLTAG